MTDQRETLATEEQRDLTLIAMLAGIVIVAGGFFILNSTGARYTTAGYQAPLPNTIPVMTPSSVPAPGAVPARSRAAEGGLRCGGYFLSQPDFLSQAAIATLPLEVFSHAVMESVSLSSISLFMQVQ